MVFLSNFAHDVFVSYAHLDNEPAVLVEGKLRGWVDMLVDKLERELRQRLGSKAVSIWIDHELAENRPLTPEILTAIRSSATLLIIMSPAYRNSEWCSRERQAFLGVVEDRVAAGCVFIVHARDVDGDIPPEFGDLTGFPFWTHDPEVGECRPLGLPDPNESPFVKRVFNLSHKLKEQLLRLKPPRPSEPPIKNGPKAGGVFVARCTEDLEEREDELRTYLEQAGLEVRPNVRYPTDSAASYEQAMARDLAQCNVFVQLLSTSRGRELDFAPGRRLPSLQHEVARRAGTPCLQWRDRGLSLDAIQNDMHRELLDGARASGFEEFKGAVVRAAATRPAESSPPRPPRGAAIFVNADAADLPFATLVGRELAGIGQLAGFDVDCFLPLRQGNPETIRLDLEKNLKECDGLLLVYGDSEPDWVRTQLRQGRKIMSLRDRPLLSLAIVEGPPPEKLDLALAVANLSLLDCRKGLDRSVLRDFVQRLQSEGVP